MLTVEQHLEAAGILYRAELDCIAAPRLSQTYPGMDHADAYSIQERWAEMHIANGARPMGRKIGLTSRAMQLATNATEPDFGILLDSKVHADGSQLSTSLFITPRIEMELAFVLGEDLGGATVQIADVMRATEFVVPALEVIDSRTQAPRPVTDAIADNAGCAGIVLGGRVVRPFDIDVRWIGGTLARNGVIEESGVSAAVLGHPAAGIAWLAKSLHRMGAKLRRGETVLAGSFIRPVPLSKGDVIHADYGPLGTVSVSFV